MGPMVQGKLMNVGKGCEVTDGVYGSAGGRVSGAESRRQWIGAGTA